MTTHKLIISSILIALLLGFAVTPAFASLTVFDWTQDVQVVSNGTTVAYGVQGTTPSPGADINRIEMTTSNNQYIFSMYLNGTPGVSNLGTIYGIYLGTTTPVTDYSVESMLAQSRKGTLYYTYLEDSVPLAGFSRPDSKTLQWKVDVTDIPEGSLYLTGATTAACACCDPPTTPIPAAAWLLGSGIVGLIGIGRRSQKSCAVAASLPG